MGYWPLYAVGSALITLRPRLISLLFPLFRIRKIRKLLVGNFAENSPKDVHLPYDLDQWTLVRLGQAIEQFQAPRGASGDAFATPSDEKRFAAQRVIASILSGKASALEPCASTLDPAAVTEGLIRSIQESLVRRSVAGVVEVSALARVLSCMGWVGAMSSLFPAVSSLRGLLRPLLGPLARPGPPVFRWLFLYYSALNLSAAPLFPGLEMPKARRVVFSIAGCGSAWILMGFEERARSRRLRFARQARRWEQARLGSTVYPFQGRGRRSSEAMLQALEWQRQVQGEDVQRSRSAMDLPTAAGGLGQGLAASGDDGGGAVRGFEIVDLDSDERHIPRRSRKMRQISKYLWMAFTSSVPALSLGSRTLGVFSSGALFVALCSGEAWLFVDPAREHERRRRIARTEAPRLAYPVAPGIMWAAKCCIRWLSPGCGGGIVFFDVGTSVFGPLALNFIALCRSSRTCFGWLLSFVELALGHYLGNDELFLLGSAFSSAFIVGGSLSAVNKVPLLILMTSGGAIYGGSSLLGVKNEKNRVLVAEQLKKVFLVN